MSKKLILKSFIAALPLALISCKNSNNNNPQDESSKLKYASLAVNFSASGASEYEITIDTKCTKDALEENINGQIITHSNQNLKYLEEGYTCKATVVSIKLGSIAPFVGSLKIDLPTAPRPEYGGFINSRKAKRYLRANYEANKLNLILNENIYSNIKLDPGTGEPIKDRDGNFVLTDEDKNSKAEENSINLTGNTVVLFKNQPAPAPIQFRYVTKINTTYKDGTGRNVIGTSTKEVSTLKIHGQIAENRLANCVIVPVNGKNIADFKDVDELYTSGVGKINCNEFNFGVQDNLKSNNNADYAIIYTEPNKAYGVYLIPAKN